MAYLAIIIGLISALIEKYYDFKENKVAKKVWVGIALFSFIIGLYQLYNQNEDSKIEKAVLKDRHKQDSIYLNKILKNQTQQQLLQINNFSKILREQSDLLNSTKKLSEENNLLQKRLELQIDEIYKSKYQITDDFYCFFSVRVSLIENNLQEYEKKIKVFSETNRAYVWQREGTKVVTQFNDSLFSNSLFSKYSEVQLNITIKKEEKPFLKLSYDGSLTFNTDAFYIPSFDNKMPFDLFITYLPENHELEIFGRIPLKIGYQNYKFNSMKDFVNSDLALSLSINNIINSALLSNPKYFNKDGFFMGKTFLKYDSLKIKLVGKKNISIYPKNLNKIGKRYEGKFQSKITSKDILE